MKTAFKCMRNLIVAGIVADSAYVYKTHRKYRAMAQQLDRMIWMSRQVIRLGTGELKSECIGIAYSELVIDLTDVDLTEDILLTVHGDYAKIRLLVKASTQLRLNGTVHFANVRYQKAVEIDESANCLNVQYALRFATLEIEVAS